MKIGVITFWDSNDNYGQLLQCYALQTFLKKLGHEVYLVRFVPVKTSRGIIDAAKHYWEVLNMSHICSFIKYRKSLKRQAEFRKTHPRCFDDFRKKFIKSTEKVYVGYRELWMENWSSFDAIITGSDQVWSYSTEENLCAYYLKWGQFDLKRIAYAVSFGRTSLPSDYNQMLPNLLSDLDFVGLREQRGVDLCQRKGCKRAQLVCDPTLLLSANDYYEDIVSDKKNKQEDSIFCYLLNWETKFPYEELKLFSKNKGLKVEFVPAHGVEDYNYFEPMKDLSIPSWLEHLKSARYVVTNSFHGTVFCILFHKPFVTFPLTGQSAGMNDRIVTLLEEMGLLDRIYSEKKSFEATLVQPIEWKEVDERLQRFRNSSIDFLVNALSKQSSINSVHNVCFQTNGGVNHDYGGLDRVTELLANYFAQKGSNVYYLSFTRRHGTDNDRQYYFPDSKNLFSAENVIYYNNFLQEKGIDVLINQEGNVNIHLPHTAVNEKIAYLTVLHFEPNYIKDYYFEYRISHLPIPSYLQKILILIVCKTKLNEVLIEYLRGKLKKNYHYQIANCDRFILLSDYFKQDISAFFPKKVPFNVYAINNPSVFSGQKKSDISVLNDKQNTVVYVGRLENGQKKLDSLLRIWKRVSAGNPDWTLKIVGSGPDECLLKQLVEQEQIKQVSFEGQQDPKRYYEEASIFCFTSGHEGWGLVLVEAQSLGCVPMAFASYSSVHDIIKDGVNGLLIAPFDEVIYANKLNELIANVELRHKMALACIETARRFSIDNIGKRWFKMIDSTIFSKRQQ